MKEYGHFSGKKFVITERDIPRHWYNYFHNDEYITFVSQIGFGQGFAQDNMGRRLPVVDDRAIYICEGKEFWQTTGLPVHSEVENFSCTHAYGYSEIALKKNGIASNTRLFVPSTGKREILSVTLTNESDCERKLKLIPYVNTSIDKIYAPQGYENDYGYFYDNKNATICTGFKPFYSDEESTQYVYITSTEKATGYDTRKSAFIGPYGDKLLPKAIINGGCTNSDCISEKLCLAIENTITLSVGESKTIHYIVGVEDNLEAIPTYTPAEIQAQFDEMTKKYDELFSRIEIKTPWEDLNSLFNDWLKFQTNMGSRWARVRHNGMRDMSSDTECLSCFEPSLAAERIMRVMTYQYENGYTPRTVMHGAIRDNNFSDNAVWMVYTVYAITKELGDISFLNREVPFNNGSIGTVYDHISRSVYFLSEFTGHYGLVKAWGGDWNDCMDMVGIKGKGVSVWLSIALVRAAKMLSEIALWLGKTEDSKKALDIASKMEKLVNEYGWEGDRYIYAISDDFYKIGAKECEEGSLTALPQLWCVLADFEDEKKKIAMDTVERDLNTDLGLLVLKPPYTKKMPHLGSLTRKWPGVHENGGVYLHASAWKLAVDSLMRRNDKVEEGLEKMLPSHHKYHVKYGEPYTMFNSYMGKETGYRVGTPGQSWRTASGQWMLYSIVRFIYGLVPEFEGLRIKPTLPPSWKECSISKTFRNCRYNINFKQIDEGSCNTIESITVNGVAHDPNTPIAPIPNQVLNIIVTLKN